MEPSLPSESSETFASEIFEAMVKDAEDRIKDQVAPVADGYIEVQYWNPEIPHQTYYLSEIVTWYYTACGSQGHDPALLRLIVRFPEDTRHEIPAIQIQRLKVVGNSKQYVEWVRANRDKVSSPRD